MARNAFYSFQYTPDNWRASQVRQMGVIEGNQAATDNDWESVTKGGDASIKSWIDGQLTGKTVAIVLIGSATANRKWINYEIGKAWTDKRGVLGIYVHNLKDRIGNQSAKGMNPFDYVSVSFKKLSSTVKVYDPPFSTSTNVYNYIKENMGDWIEAAIKIRSEN